MSVSRKKLLQLPAGSYSSFCDVFRKKLFQEEAFAAYRKRLLQLPGKSFPDFKKEAFAAFRRKLFQIPEESFCRRKLFRLQKEDFQASRNKFFRLLGESFLRFLVDAFPALQTADH